MIRLWEKLQFELHVFPEGGHGLNLAEDNPQASQWLGLCSVWLQKLGFIPIKSGTY